MTDVLVIVPAVTFEITGGGVKAGVAKMALADEAEVPIEFADITS